MLKTIPSIDVIINVYNGEEFIENCINQLSLQTYRITNIIVIDNGSTDRTSEICRQFQNIIYDRIPETISLYSARNHALQFATSDFISFCDVDDVWLPFKLENQVQKLSDNTNKLVVSNFLRQFTGNDTRNEVIHPCLPEKLAPYSHFFKPYVHFSSMLVERELAKSIKFDDNLTILGDADFLYRATAITEIKCGQSFDTVYVYHGGNTGMKKYEMIVSEFSYLSEKYRTLDVNLASLCSSYSRYLSMRLNGAALGKCLLTKDFWNFMKIAIWKRFY